MDPITLGLAAGGALIGAVGGAANRRKAREEELSNYNTARDYLDSLYYRDPLSTVGNRSLLKAVRQNYADNLDALQNRAVAGGATMENALAARQANNENLDKVYGQLLQGEEARRSGIDRQRMQLDAQHSAAVQNSYLQAAQDWQSWGSAMGNAALAYGSANLLGGLGDTSSAATAAGAAAGTGDYMGLKGVHLDSNGVPRLNR